ncbi:MAG TPA: SDR family NAD(P)-dependent oxidoreductase [Anaerolineae bacterium]|nr:SDR family NAD(P)-dependent oxidoreductase [Anaerolineae bacterium]
MEVSGHTALITGGGTGIGLALAEQLSRLDNTVLICGRREEPLEQVTQRLANVHYRVCDVSQPDERRKLADWATSEFEQLDLLVNNAGIQRVVSFLSGERDLEDADQEIFTNLVAPIHLSTLLIPHLQDQPEPAIVNITSGLAFTPLAGVPVYCATKAALHSLSLTLRHQLRSTPIKVFEIAPPMVASELHGRRRDPEQESHLMSAGEAASGIIQALQEDRYEVALGSAERLREQREALFSALNG